jgi:hypothetical protein
MAKRLHMTNADYVTIALSPALVMLMVGSLVFFLIDVLYVGEYQARLSYVFALFVFAAVLIARISIEEGAEYASLFALPLGGATFLVLMKFVEHASPFNWLINIGLMFVVWWCAHKLTWDCTLIDDEEDSSGEGLLQRMGADEGTTASDAPPAENELLTEPDKASAVGVNQATWWQRLLRPKKGKHTPGLWVLYFSLAALPLFGVGQYWVPATEVGRRQYVFSLLLVYVASALALLVATSFLGLRRYLRQRHLEMPGPMAVNWVGIGAVLIVVVMLLAALIPRPHAEYAISQVPWQATSPGGLSSSRHAPGQDGSEEHDAQGQAIQEDAPQGEAVREDGTGDPAESDQGKPSGEPGGKQEKGGAAGEESKSDASQPGQQGEQQQQREQQESESGESSTDQRESNEQGSGSPQESSADERKEDKKEQDEKAADGGQASAQTPQHSADEKPFQLPKVPTPDLNFLAGVLKLIFYIALAVAAAVFFWRNRHALAQAARDILRQLRELLARLFGGRTVAADSVEDTASKPTIRHRTFAEFRDPFASGEARRLAPEELVRYTFEAFEAWSRDAGHSRSPDQTPAELVQKAVDPQSPLHEEARRMTRIYSEVAYAAARPTPQAVERLGELWSLMRANSGRRDVVEAR